MNGGLPEGWWAKLESADVGEAVARYLEIWNLRMVNAERLEALGVPPADFEALLVGFTRGIEMMGYEGHEREAHLFLLGLGVGRQLGVLQATEASGGG